MISKLFLAVAGLAAVLSNPANAVTIREAAAAKGIYFGAAVDPAYLDSSSEPLYASTLKTHFSSVTPENHMKWTYIEPSQNSYTWTNADKIVDFAVSNSQEIRGHTLIWHQEIPTWVSGGSWTNDQLWSILQNHIEVTVTRYKGKIKYWDVVNEVLGDSGDYRTDSFWYTKFNSSYIAQAFKWANAADPSAKLFINEYSLEWSGSKIDKMYSVVSDLLSKGVPVHGVGFQAHYGAQWGGSVPDSITSNLQRFVDLGVDVAVTELDDGLATPASTSDLNTQKTTFYKTVTDCLNVVTKNGKKCVGVTTWGFTDAHSWVSYTYSGYGEALEFDSSYNPKPAYTGILSALGAASTTTTTTTTTTTKSSTTTTTTKSSATTTTTKSSATTTSSSKTTTTTTKTSTTSSAATSTASCSAKWGQCGGQGWSGATCCVSGSTCTYNNAYYSQCL